MLANLVRRTAFELPLIAEDAMRSGPFKTWGGMRHANGNDGYHRLRAADRVNQSPVGFLSGASPARIVEEGMKLIGEIYRIATKIRRIVPGTSCVTAGALCSDDHQTRSLDGRNSAPTKRPNTALRR